MATYTLTRNTNGIYVINLNKGAKKQILMAAQALMNKVRPVMSCLVSTATKFWTKLTLKTKQTGDSLFMNKTSLPIASI